MQVGSGSGNFRQNRVGSVRVKLNKVNKKTVEYLTTDII